MSDQHPLSRSRPGPIRKSARCGAGFALAVAFGPAIASAQGVATVPAPAPAATPAGNPPRTVVVPPTVVTTPAPSAPPGPVTPSPVIAPGPVITPPPPQPAPFVPATVLDPGNPKVLELSPTGPAPAPAPAMRPVTPPAAPTIIPIEPIPVPPGTPPGGSRVINLTRDTTGMVPSLPPGPPVRRPVDEMAGDVRELISKIQEPEAEISVPVGQTKLIETRRLLTRVAIANSGVADVELLTDQPNSRLLHLYGKSFGLTNMTLWDTEDRPVSFLVRVTLDTRDLENRVKQAFPGSFVQVRQVGAQILLDGQVADNKTMSDILQLIQTEVRYGLMRAGMMGGGGMGGMGGMGSMMGGGVGGSTAGTSGGTAGSTASGGGMSGGSMSMGGGMGGGMGMGGSSSSMGSALVIINRVHVPGPRQVLLHVKIAELNRDAIRQLGVNWFRTENSDLLGSTIGGLAGIAGTSSTTQTSSAISGVVKPVASAFSATGTAASSGSDTLFGIFHAGHFSAFINALKSNAMAKILAEPNVMVLDGQAAQFIAGGLFPYPVPQSSSIPGGTAVVTVQFAKFGTILTCLPNILPNDVIRLDVEPIFSALNFGEGTTINGGRVPAIDQRSARTVVELREGQTLAIAGLLQQTVNASTLRIPGLGDLPIVGPLFSNNSTETVESELIVLVTPELVAPMENTEVPEAPGDRVIQPNDFEFYFLGRIEGKSGTDFRATVRELDPLNVMKHFQSENQWVIGPHGYCD